MPPDPAKKLHANTPYTVPWSGRNGPNNCMSRGDLLNGATPSAFGSAQSMQICVDSNEKNDPTERPHLWPPQGNVINVPRVVILSSLPFWTAWWKSCYFYGPRDVIGQMFTPPFLFGNYYYFDQWNDVDPTTPDYAFAGGNPTYDVSQPAYQNNSVWSTFDATLTSTDKSTVYNAKSTCLATCEGADCATCDAVPSFLFNLCSIPPDERFSKIICTATNPYYQLHKDITAAFLAAKTILESDPVNPIYVIIPEWLPTELHQVRNAFLKQQHEKQNGAHGGVANGKPCAVVDIEPCYTSAPVCWAPAYPDVNDPRNSGGFQTPTVPWLASLEPGFGTEVLHLYVGHPCMKYFASNSTWDWQAWPLSPEVQFLGPIFTGNYLGASLPFFSGRRAIWRDLGFDYGYTGAGGAVGLYDGHYSGIVGPAADTYKANFYNFRNITTQLFTYPATWNFGWNLHHIWKDQENTCDATQFYFGFANFGDFVSFYEVNPDNNVTDCDPMVHLKVAESHNNFPLSPDLATAEGVFYPPIRTRVENYYKGIEPGSATFFQTAIARNGLADYNVSYEGALPGALLSADGLVAYIRGFFFPNS